MDVLKKLFNSSVNQASPVQEDFDRVVKVDEKGNEHVVFEKTDYPSIQSSHGFASDWTLTALLKSGVNPNFGIHTGLPTRIEGASIVNEFEKEAEGIFPAQSSETPEDSEN